MSQENVAVVQQAFEAYMRRDNETALSLYDPEIEIESNFDGRTYRGLEGVQAFFHDWLEAWDDIGGEVVEWIDVSDDVIAVMRNWARGKISGVTVERSESHLWTLRGGRLRRLRVFETKAEALEAAGLRG
jgi:ketosteroid isomerase-like protein